MPSLTWLEHVANGEAFAAENFAIGVGGMFVHIQLFNPVGSGKRVRMRSANATLGFVQVLTVSRHDVALGTLGLPAGFIVENLLGGGPAEVAEMRSAIAAVPVGAQFWSLNAAGNDPAIYPPEAREWGLDLLPGQGMLISGAAGSTVIINWHWVEVPL